MKRLRWIVAGVVVLAGVAAVAQDTGYWRAENETAKSITGDIGLGTQKLSINFVNFTVAQIRIVEPAEAKAVFDLDDARSAAGNLYRLEIPAGRKFLHKNSLCGSEDTFWMVTAVTGREMHVAFFSGAAAPKLDVESVLNGTNLCGTFLYQR